MTDAYVHVIAEPTAISEAADSIADSDHVEELHLVTGEYDIAAVVTEDIHAVSGVIETVTNVAFEP